MSSKILVIDDEEPLRFTFEKFLLSEGYEVTGASEYNEAMSFIVKTNFDVIFSDIILCEKTGIDILREVKERNMTTQVIMITGQPNIETASDSLRLGAFDYIPKPVSKKTLLDITGKALRHRALLDENIRYRSNLEAIFRSVGDAIITVNNDLNLLEVNESSEKICGLRRGDAGRLLSDLIKDCDGRCLDAVRTCINENRRVEIYQLRCQRREQEAQVVNITASPLLSSGGIPYGSVMTVRDETRLSELERNLEERRQFHNIIGKSKKMQKIYALIEDLADIESTVLITGETGTGKELIAEAIHYKGLRFNKPLVKVNCSALAESLLESELFGHVKGAFTGAVKDKAGRFQMADGGTVFLDEIGDISAKVQLQLLRVIQEKEFERVGDSKPIKVDVRVVAATNKDLRKKTKKGEFREDLFYRLKVVEIAVPPLRERKEDISLLGEHFLKKCGEKAHKTVNGISPEIEKIFMEYDWPGNVRELEHAIEHACIVTRQPSIITDDLPPELREDISDIGEGDKYNNDLILQTLEKAGWNVSKASRMLGISRPLLYKKIKELKADRE